MVTPLRDILKGAVKAWGLQPAARLAALRDAWPRVAGRELAGVSAPLGVRDGRLAVGVTHPAAGQEIRLRAGTIVKAANRALGEEAVREIRVVSRRRLPGPTSASPRSAGPGPDARGATRG